MRKCIDSALSQEVAQTVKEVEQEVIEDEVYNAYTPKFYERRGFTGGGLGDISNMHSDVKNNTLTVSNLTPPNPNYRHDALKSNFIGSAVELGERYDFYNPGARPFTEKTVDKLEHTQKHVDALKKGLKRQGLKTD